MAGQLGTLAGPRMPRCGARCATGSADVTVSSGGPEARVLIQDARHVVAGVPQGTAGHLRRLACWGHRGVLALFFLFRGRIRIDGERRDAP